MGSQNKDQPTDYDLITLSRYGMFGVALYPPVYYYWYVFRFNVILFFYNFYNKPKLTKVFICI